MMLMSGIIILILTISSYKCENESHTHNEKFNNSTENSKAAIQNFSKEENGPSQQLKKKLLGDGNESRNTYLPIRKNLRRIPRNNYEYSMMPQVIPNPEKIKPGQYAGKRSIIFWYHMRILQSMKCINYWVKTKWLNTCIYKILNCLNYLFYV